MPYIGNQPFGKTVRTVTTETIASAKTAYYPNGGYMAGYVDVFVNGVRLSESLDFTATDGSLVTLLYTPSSGDTVEIVTYGSVEIANAVRRSGDTFSGNVYVGSNVYISTSTISVGNATVNTQITAGNIALNGSTLTIGNSTVNTVFTGDTVTVGGSLSLGNTAITGTANVTTTINVGTNVSMNTTSIRVGNSTINTYIVSDTIYGPSTLYIDPAAAGDNTGLVVVKGDLQVDGTTFIINSANVTVNDKNVVLASGAINNAATDGAGLTIYGTNANLTYNATGNNFEMSRGLSVTGTANVSVALNVGANVNLSTSQINVGNSTVNTVITSTLLSTNGITVAGGTANGVAYLNSSKVLTTGSALTFDGTTLTNTRNTTDGSASTLTLNNSGATGSYATLNLNAGSVTYQQFSDAAGNAIGTAGAMFRTTSNHPLIWGTNNTERMRLDSSGNLGIGTNSPAARLSFGGYIPSDGQTVHIYNSGNVRSGLGVVSGVYRVFTDSGSVLSFGQVSTSDGSTYTERARIDSSGNLLVGISSGSYKFMVGDGTRNMTINPNSIMDGIFLGTTTAKPLIFGTTDTDRARFDTSGNLVIGNTSAWGRLHATKSVNNTNASATNISDYQNATFILHNQDDVGTGNKAGMFFAFAGSPGILAGMDGYKVSGNWNTGLRWYTNNSTGVNTGNFTERMRLDPDGRLGLGVTSPTWMLEVQGAQESLASFRPSTSTSAGYARFINGGGTFYIGIESSNGTRISASGLAYAASMTTEGNTALTFGTNNTNRMTIDTSGNLVVGGTTAYSARLYVQGNSLGSSGTLYKFGDQHTYKWGGYNSQVGNSGRTLFAYGYDPLNWNYHYLKLKIKRGYYYASGYAEYMINCQNGTVTQVSQTDSGTTTSSITLSNNTVNSNYRITTVSFVSPANYTTWDFELEFWGMTPVSWTTTPGAGNIALN